jgi:prolyl oligopeptidase PreP (S9A serine peptidase family)
MDILFFWNNNQKLMSINPKWPVYYYENMEGGHGGAADAKQTAFMTSLAYDFMFQTLTNNIIHES